MPTSVNDLFLAVTGLTPQGPLKWGHVIPCHSMGVYVISSNAPIVESDISQIKIENWIEKVIGIEMDSHNPSSIELKSRLSSFLYPDETILYIGQTGHSVRTRLNQFYSHILGNAKPHRGGHWLKTLTDIENLDIYWLPTNDPEITEDKMLEYFAANLSPESKALIYDPLCPIPFANLKFGNKIKKHSIKSQTREFRT